MRLNSGAYQDSKHLSFNVGSGEVLMRASAQKVPSSIDGMRAPRLYH
jgi:hypothetical protein